MEACVQGAADLTAAQACAAAGANALAAGLQNPQYVNPASSATNVDTTTGAITVTATADLDSETFELAPSPALNTLTSVGQQLQWVRGGTCIDAGFC
nr:hypothetical protein [Aeromonas simiae]